MVSVEKSSVTVSDQSATSSTTNVTSKADSTVEKGNAWDGYQDDPVPEKTQGRIIRNLRHQIFSLYRRLFGVIFVVNMAILIAIFARGGANAQELGLIVVANLFCAVLMRQDYVINAFFTVFCAVPQRFVCAIMTFTVDGDANVLIISWPLAIRRICARVYHIGGCKCLCWILQIRF